jgi:hypothetical protein
VGLTSPPSETAEPVGSDARLDTLHALIESQDGAVSYQQLDALGLHRSTLAYRMWGDGPWQRLLPGVCLAQSGPPTVQQKARAALLYAGPDAILTGCEALVRHGIDRVPPDADIHVLVTDGNQKSSRKCRLEELVAEVRDGQIRGSRFVRLALADAVAVCAVHVTPRQVRREPQAIHRHLAGALDAASGPGVRIIAFPAGTPFPRRFD